MGHHRHNELFRLREADLRDRRHGSAGRCDDLGVSGADGVEVADFVESEDLLAFCVFVRFDVSFPTHACAKMQIARKLYVGFDADVLTPQSISSLRHPRSLRGQSPWYNRRHNGSIPRRDFIVS